MLKMVSKAARPVPVGDHGFVLGFVQDAQCMLDPATSEARRIELEQVLLSKLPCLKALGIFDFFEPRSPAMKAWLQDELEQLELAPSPSRCAEG